MPSIFLVMEYGIYAKNETVLNREASSNLFRKWHQIYLHIVAGMTTCCCFQNVSTETMYCVFVFFQTQKAQHDFEEAQKETQKSKELHQNVQNQLTQNQSHLTQVRTYYSYGSWYQGAKWSWSHLCQLFISLDSDSVVSDPGSAAAESEPADPVSERPPTNQDPGSAGRKGANLVWFILDVQSHQMCLCPGLKIQAQNQMKSAQSQAQARQNHIQQLQRELQQTKETLQQNLTSQKELQQTHQNNQNSHNQEVGNLKTTLSQAEAKVDTSTFIVGQNYFFNLVIFKPRCIYICAFVPKGDWTPGTTGQSTEG